jgi:hypothetical protein
MSDLIREARERILKSRSPYQLNVISSDLAERLADALEAAEAKVLRVVRGEFTQICSYCGWEGKKGGEQWEGLQAHIAVCPAHPMRKVEARVRELEAQWDSRDEWVIAYEGDGIPTNHFADDRWTYAPEAVKRKVAKSHAEGVVEGKVIERERLICALEESRWFDPASIIRAQHATDTEDTEAAARRIASRVVGALMKPTAGDVERGWHVATDFIQNIESKLTEDGRASWETIDEVCAALQRAIEEGP